MERDVPSRFELILGVHDLAEQPDASGDEQLSWVPFSQARPLLDEALANSRITGVPLSVTSDDAFRSDYELLLPWLVDNGVPGLFFIPTRFVDRPGRLTQARIREMAGMGMRFGVHGAHHINWLKASPSDFLADAGEGKDRLEQMLGAAVDCAAPPFGAYDGAIAARLRGMGLTTLYTSRSGLALKSCPIKPRNMVKPSQLALVRQVSRDRGTFRDAARCRLRLLRAYLEAMVRRR